MGRQACTAIERRTASVRTKPRAPCICFSFRNSTAQSFNRCRSASVSPCRNGRLRVTCCHSASSSAKPRSARFLRQVLNNPNMRRLSPICVWSRPGAVAGRYNPVMNTGVQTARVDLPEPALDPIAAGLPEADAIRLRRAYEFALAVYADKLLGTGEPVLEHALGVVTSLTELRLDVETRIAGIDRKSTRLNSS